MQEVASVGGVAADGNRRVGECLAPSPPQFSVSSPEKRFDVELFIVHPTLDPSKISAGLRLDANLSHRVGDQRKTLKGTPLPGTHRDLPA